MSAAEAEEFRAGGAARGSSHQQPKLDRPMALLGAAVVAAVIGMAASGFRGDGTAVNSFLFLDMGRSHGAAAQIERTAVSLVLLASIAGVVWRRWVLFIPAAGYMFAEALARWHVQGQPFSDWALVTQAARYVAPLSLALLVLGAARKGFARTWFSSTGEWTLRIALAAVFASHGFEALMPNPVFVDLIISTAANITGMRVTESTAVSALEVIGFADFAVAGAILLWPHRAILAWAAFWGVVTALARVTANGWGAYPDVLVRASYFLGPVALALLIARRVAAKNHVDGAAPACGKARRRGDQREVADCGGDARRNTRSAKSQ